MAAHVLSNARMTVIYRGQVVTDPTELPSDANVAADVASGAITRPSAGKGKERGGTWPP
jgi:predicted dinucleotide-utilizing enzyme